MLPRAVTHIALIVAGLFIGLIAAVVFYPSLAVAPEASGITADIVKVIRPATPPVESKSATVVMVGDIMLARTVEATIEKNGLDFPFAKLDPALFAGADIVSANFETSIRNARRVEDKQLVFDTMPEYATALTSAGFTHVSLANNHTDDYGPEIMKSTRQSIIDAGLVPFGDSYASAPFVATKTVNGLPISLIGFHAFNETLPPILEAIKTEHAAGHFVIVMPHWGNEYEHDPNSNQITTAHAMIDAGADVIIGAHPHVVQSTEVYRGKPIAYSLGNFLFDQDFSEETKTGALVRLIITPEKVDLKFEPIRIIGKQMSLGEQVWAEKIGTWLKLPNLTLSTSRAAIVEAAK